MFNTSEIICNFIYLGANKIASKLFLKMRFLGWLILSLGHSSIINISEIFKTLGWDAWEKFPQMLKITQIK